MFKSPAPRRRTVFARHHIFSVSLAIVVGIILPAAGLFRLTVARADNTPQTLPFSQNWTNTGLITANDSWSGVPGVEGYLGQDITTATGTDPQTLLTSSAVANDLTVLANQTATTITNGDVAEFHTTSQPAPAGTNPTIALQGSGTADAPYLLLYLNTTGQTAVNVSYNLRDIDCTADNAAQQVALQYRVGTTGNFTNVPAGYVADATTGPSICTAVTAVSATLPAAADNQSVVQVRIITTNAAGNDEWVGVDDISVTGTAAGGGVTLAINDVSQSEGNAGTTAFTFTVSLSSATHGGVTFHIGTADGTAHDGSGAGEDTDYTATALGDQTIPNGTQTYQFTVQVNGDTTVEPNETFAVNVVNVTGANTTDGQGMGTIVNDDLAVTPIHTIQGSSTTSPMVGQVVMTTGVVTLRKTGQNTGHTSTANGYFLQTPDAAADSDPNTSQGIFVFTSTVPTVNVGDEVRVTGTVVEFNGLTEITTVTNTSVIDTGNELPTAVSLDSTILDPEALPTQPQLEKYEGMRMSAASVRTVAPNDNFYDVDVVVPAAPRPMREPGMEISNTIPPDPTTGTPDCCIPRWDENPERLKLDTNGRAGASNVGYTSNVTFTGISGPLDFSFGEYRLVLEAAPAASPNMSAVPVPTPTGSEYTVAGFNIENFNSTDTVQLHKAALAIRTVLHLPDIIGHVEIENLSSLQALAQRVNDDEVAASRPNPQYEARLIPTPVAGITQNVGFLVKTSRVRIDDVTQERTGDTYTLANGSPDETHDRPPLVLKATVEPTGANKPIIVVVNHTRSFIDIELNNDTGRNVRAKRKAQAESLAGLFQELQTNFPGRPVIAVGDYNAFQFNNGYDDPVSVMEGQPTPDDQIVVDQSPDLVNPDFYNLINDLTPEQQYTFVFEGTPQALDHVLVNTAAHARNTRIAIARNNADFPSDPAPFFATDSSRPERNSDHDIPVAYFSLTPTVQPGQVLISELRFRGPDPSGASNEFIELYNNTNSDITVQASDGTTGWSVVAQQSAVSPALAGPSAFPGVTRLFIIENGTTIPARGHYLAVNTDGYSLGTYGARDNTYAVDVPDDAGVALFTTANLTNLSADTRLDAAGVAASPIVALAPSTTDPLYYEGTGLPGPVSTNSEYSYVRKLNTGRPQDTGNNAADFVVVSTAPGAMSIPAVLGAPGPEGKTSPVQHNGKIKSTLFDSQCSGTGTAVANPTPGASPDGTPAIGTCQNRARDTLSHPTISSTSGTLYIRRRFINATAQNVTRLRFRVVDITTLNSPGYTLGGAQADLRPLSAGDVTITTTGGEIVPVRGLTLEQPPNQPSGGGLNSTVFAGTIMPETPLAPGASIAVQFRLGVEQPGTFRFFVNTEAVLSPPTTSTRKLRAKAGGGDDNR